MHPVHNRAEIDYTAHSALSGSNYFNVFAITQSVFIGVFNNNK